MTTLALAIDSSLPRGVDASIVRRQTAAARLRNFAPFSAQDYLSLHADIDPDSIDPAQHAFDSGAHEGRTLFKREQIIRALSLAAGKTDTGAGGEPGHLSDEQLTAFREAYPRITIYVGSDACFATREIAETCVRLIDGTGAAVTMRDEKDEIDRAASLSFVVAPHAFFTPHLVRKWADSDAMNSVFFFNTAPLDNPGFSRVMPALMSARGVIDLSAPRAELFNDAGIPSLCLSPTVEPRSVWLTASDLRHALVRILPAQARADAQIMEHAAEELPDMSRTPDVTSASQWENRAIDISFVGNDSVRRGTFFAKNARFFADYPAFIHLRRYFPGAPSPASEIRAQDRIAGHVAAHSKISLHIHQTEFPYFSWHRMVQKAMGSGAVLVSEPCFRHPGIIPGEHFFEEGGRHIPHLVEWLLNDASGRKSANDVRENARQLIERQRGDAGRRSALVRFLSAAMAGGVL